MIVRCGRRCASIALSVVVAGLACAHAAEPELTNPAASVAAEESPSDADPAGGDDLLDLDLDQLSRADVRVSAMGEVGLDTVVSTVSRTDTSVRQTPSAVYVVTQDMIRRSGARNVMEVLRTVPGVHVARINASTWAISIRGFNGAFSDKLLVQIDERPIYNQFFSGVFWELQLVPLKDVERIEVIRGSGGSVWGSNAVNGIINIVTKDSQDTTGAYVEAGGGDEHRSFSHARIGGQIGRNATYRVYGAQIEDDSGMLPVGDPPDARRGTMVGFRLDWRPSCDDTLTLQGDLTEVTQSLGADGNQSSLGNLHWRWNRQVDADTDWSVGAFYDRTKIDYNAGSLLANEVWQNVIDVDFKWHTITDNHEWVCGVGYRNYETFNSSGPGQALDFVPDKDVFNSVSYFVQDTVTLSDDLLFLTLGCKFEHNGFVGFLYQPAAKLALTPDERTSFWASVSRAVRTPSVTNRDIQFIAPIGGGQFLRVNGSRSTTEEQAITYELGMRRQPTERFYWDFAAYFTRYEDLIKTRPTGVTPPFANGVFANFTAADTYGCELWGTYEAAGWQRFRASYSYFREVFNERGVSSFELLNVPGTYPSNMANLVSSTDLTDSLTLDATLRYVDSLSGVSSYLEMDMRLGWGLRNGLEAAIVGQNLLQPSRDEFIEPSRVASTSGVQRSVFGVLSWEY